MREAGGRRLGGWELGAGRRLNGRSKGGAGSDLLDSRLLPVAAIYADDFETVESRTAWKVPTPPQLAPTVAPALTQVELIPFPPQAVNAIFEYAIRIRPMEVEEELKDRVSVKIHFK